MPDQSLTDLTDPPAESTTPAPDGIETDDPTTQWSIEEILEQARTPETTARFCIRADLEAEHADLMREISQLVDAQGQLLVDDDASLSATSNAQGKVARLNQVEAQMRTAMRAIRFRGLTADELVLFEKKWLPKDDTVDGMAEFNLRLAAATAVAPELTFDGMKQMKSKLGSRALIEIIRKARSASYGGGVDVPKSPSVLQALLGGRPENS